MALLAEEIVEEWLNRNGFFTIRGVKSGQGEIDLLALRPEQIDGSLRLVCRHVEVQVSLTPIGYISRDSAKRVEVTELQTSVETWIHKKFDSSKKQEIRKNLWSGAWTYELVVHKVRHEDELSLIEQGGIYIHRLKDILNELADSHAHHAVNAASGADFVNLVLLSHSVETAA